MFYRKFLAFCLPPMKNVASVLQPKFHIIPTPEISVILIMALPSTSSQGQFIRMISVCDY